MDDLSQPLPWSIAKPVFEINRRIVLEVVERKPRKELAPGDPPSAGNSRHGEQARPSASKGRRGDLYPAGLPPRAVW